MEEVERKKEFLLEKRKRLKNMTKENELLDSVKQDYDKYYNFILREKKEQMAAMEKIKKSLDDIIIFGKLTDIDLFNAKKEQDEIIKEMGNIKNKLDDIVNKK
jgi:hypothetical protein